MMQLLAKVQRAFARHGVTITPAQLAQVLATLEQNGVTLAPLHLTSELRIIAVEAGHRAKLAGVDRLDAVWRTLTSRALHELAKTELARDCGELMAELDLEQPR